MKIIRIDSNDLERVQKIAYATWPDTFKNILSEAQIDYMLNWMYSLETLEKQLALNHSFYIAEKDGIDLGFIGIEANYSDNKTTKIHKIYILPETQGMGIGKKLIDFVKNKVKSDYNNHQLILNVNRFNNAVEFYKKLGFKIIKEENIDIGKGYLMEDYIMLKKD